MAERLQLPGFVNAHSHAFQRSMRGRVEGGDFWAWRETMLVEAGIELQPAVELPRDPQWLATVNLLWSDALNPEVPPIENYERWKQARADDREG